MMTSPTGSRRLKSNLTEARSGKQEAGKQKEGSFQPPASSLQPKGLTLIEVLISVILLATGAVLVMQSFATAWETVSRTDERSTALAFAMSKLADLQLAHQQGLAVDEQASGSFRLGAKPFKWSVQVKPSGVIDDPSQQVTLSIHWPHGRITDESRFTLLLPPLPEKNENDKT